MDVLHQRVAREFLLKRFNLFFKFLSLFGYLVFEFVDVAAISRLFQSYIKEFDLGASIINPFQFVENVETVDSEVDFYYGRVNTFFTDTRLFGILNFLLDLLPYGKLDADFVPVLTKAFRKLV